MIARSPRALRRLPLVASLLALTAAAGCNGCKKTSKPEEVKKEVAAKPVTIEETPMPDGVVLELDIKDPESVAKRASDGMSMGLGPSPYEKLLEVAPSDDAKKLFRALDPHGAISLVMLYDFAKKGDPEFVAAVHLKDPEVARTIASTISKAKNADKAEESKALGTTLYGDADVAYAFLGDVGLIGHPKSAVDKVGKFVAYRASKGAALGHDLLLRSPASKFGDKLSVLAKDTWTSGGGSGSKNPDVKAETEKLVGALIGAIADLGDTDLALDIVGDELHAEQTLAVKGDLAKAFAAWPAGDANALLSLPRGDTAGLYRIPDGLGPVAYAGFASTLDDASKPAPNKAELVKALRAIGGGLGHDVAYVTHEPTSGGSGGVLGAGVLDTEILVRIDVVDAAGIKAAAPLLVKEATRDKSTPTKVKALAAMLGEGQVVSFPSISAALTGMGAGGSGGTPPADDTFTWAVKDGFVFLDFAPRGDDALLQAALDPAKKSPFDGDATARAKVGSFPAKKVIAAGYGTSLGLGGFGALGMLTGGASASKKGSAPFWSWVTVDGSGLTSKGSMPLSWLGDMTKAILAIAGRSGSMLGGSPMPGAGAAPF
jgi:hypothetical protein